MFLMALNNNDQTRIREFLLGKLSKDEQQKIEERLIVEEDLFNEFEISKGELVEEYCANELTEEEHQWFERHFLASPEGKETYAFAVALGGLQRGASKPPDRLTFLDQLKELSARQLTCWDDNPNTLAIALYNFYGPDLDLVV